MNSRPPGIKAEVPTPMGMSQPGPHAKDPRTLLPTFIYDYFLKTRRPDLAQHVLNANIGVITKDRTKASPSGRDANGISDGMPKDDITEKIEKMPVPEIMDSLPNESFLQDWFSTFWDIWNASRNQMSASKPANEFIHNANRMKQQQNMMMNPGVRRMVGGGMGNGMNSIQNQAMVNNLNRRNPMMPQNQMAQAGAEGQRPQSPLSGDNQPSPKRQRLDFPNQGMAAGGNPAMPGQPPNMPSGMDPSQLGLINGIGMMDAENRMPNAQGGGALADYQMQLMLLEQQNKRRLLMARQEQEVVSGTAPPGATPQPAMMNQQGMPFSNMPPGMSPRRNGQSPSPNDPMKRNPSQLGQSPRPDGMAVTRGSPAPGMFDHNGQQAAMANQQFFANGQMRPNGMVPGAPQTGFQGPNGQMRQMGMQGPRPGGPPGQFPPGMPPFGQNPQQQPQNPNNPAGNPQGNQPGGNPMPPPQAPANQAGRTNPSSPAQAPAPPTPRQGEKAAPKKKDTGKKEAANKKAQPKKAGANQHTENEPQPPTPTPSTPVDPHPPPSVLSKNQTNGTQQPTAGPNGLQPQAGHQPDAMPGMDPQSMTGMGGVGDANADGSIGDFNFEFGGPTGTDVLDGFDFDSFLQVDGDANNFDFGAPAFDMNPGMGEQMAENQQ